jgi:hypothetical protein
VCNPAIEAKEVSNSAVFVLAVHSELFYQYQGIVGSISVFQSGFLYKFERDVVHSKLSQVVVRARGK